MNIQAYTGEILRQDHIPGLDSLNSEPPLMRRAKKAVIIKNATSLRIVVIMMASHSIKRL